MKSSSWCGKVGARQRFQAEGIFSALIQAGIAAGLYSCEPGPAL